MVMICKNLGVTYYSVPKVACTSLKMCLHGLEHGEPYDRKSAGQPLHAAYPSRTFDLTRFEELDGTWRFAIVRDPIKRILSAYSNKIGRFNRAEARKEARRNRAVRRILSLGLLPGKRVKPQLAGKGQLINGLEVEPTPSEFCENFDDYRQTFQIIRYHTRPFHQLLGNDLSRFDAVYPIEQLDQFARDLSERTGLEVTLPRANESRRKITLDMISDAGKQNLIRATREDYELLNDFYKSPVALAGPEQ